MDKFCVTKIRKIKQKKNEPCHEMTEDFRDLSKKMGAHQDDQKVHV
jgi:hypothetical protein